MKTQRTGVSLIVIALVFMVVFSSSLLGQAKYRTFNQSDLAGKKSKAGRMLGSSVCFVFRNDSAGIAGTSLHVRLNSSVTAILDSGGFSTFTFGHRHKEFTATGRVVGAGDSVDLCFNVEKKSPGTRTTDWWWDTNGVRVGAKRSDIVGTFTAIQIQPNGGFVREYLYKHVVRRPYGLLVGYPTDTPGVGWIRYKSDDRKYFPHTDTSRCFDFITDGRGNEHPFVGELKNPHVKKHNNHLLGEVHALKLAVVANDSGITEPDTGTALGDLVYNDPAHPSDPANGMTIRGFLHIVDSALTYCGHFTATDYFAFDSSVSRINKDFDGPYVAVSFKPLVLAGMNTLPPYLHPNPSAAPGPARRMIASVLDEEPSAYALSQNYPNPFNPSTTIEFTLPRASIVTLKVYNLLGQEVATVFDRTQLDQGEKTVAFDASSLASGVYFYRIIAQNLDGGPQVFQSVKRMVLIK